MYEESAFIQISVMGAFVIGLALFALWAEGQQCNQDLPKD